MALRPPRRKSAGAAPPDDDGVCVCAADRGRLIARQMSPVLRASLLSLALLSAFSPLRANKVIDFLLPRPDLQVITVTEMTPEGRQFTPATPAQPQYYVATSLGYQDFGSVIAGIKAPPPAEVQRLIGAELAKRGYRAAAPDTPAPTLVLAYAWGTLNAETMSGQNDTPEAQINHAKIVAFLGGKKVGLDDNFFSPFTAPAAGLQATDFDARDLYDIAREDFFVIVVSAYDLAEIRQHRKKLLWMTRISAPSRGFELADIAPAMLKIASAHFGRETERPVWMTATEKFKATVTPGELKVVGYEEDKPAAPSAPTPQAPHTVPAKIPER